MPYSKEQKIEYNKKYRQKMTEEQKEAQRISDREYYHKNKEKVDERNMRYYQENKEKLKEKRVPYFNNRRTLLKEEAKQKLREMGVEVYRKGGKVKMSTASKRADGIAQRGKTKGRMV